MAKKYSDKEGRPSKQERARKKRNKKATEKNRWRFYMLNF